MSTPTPKSPAPARPSHWQVTGAPPAGAARPVTIDVATLVRGLVTVAVLLALVSAANAALHLLAGTSSLEFVNVDQEGNLPTWFQSGLLAACAIVATLIAVGMTRAGAPFRWHWAGLAALMFATSIDEEAQVHELLIDPMRSLLHTDGFLRFAWVVPGFAVVVVLAAVYFRFLRSQDRATRRGLFAAAALYLTGALVIEAFSGAISADGLYAASTTVEESFEMAGQLMLLWTLLRFWAPGGTIAIAPRV